MHSHIKNGKGTRINMALTKCINLAIFRDEMKKIGDVMKNFAPFLKLYSEYVKNYSKAMSVIDVWQGKSPPFCAIMDEIQKMPECGLLTLQHHMMEPIQRVPRYELLLQSKFHYVCIIITVPMRVMCMLHF